MQDDRKLCGSDLEFAASQRLDRGFAFASRSISLSAAECSSSAPISLAFSMNARDWASSSCAGFVFFWRCDFFRIIDLIHGRSLPFKQLQEIVLAIVFFNGQR
jgi:hypothetical protein